MTARAMAALLLPILEVCAQAQTFNQVQPLAQHHTLQLLGQIFVPGAFTTSQSIAVDPSGKYIFGASEEGTLFTVQNQAPNFPLVPTLGTIPVSAAPLRSIVENGQNLYMTSQDGQVHFLNANPPYLFTSGVVNPEGLLSLAVTDGANGQVTVSEGQGVMAMDSRHIYLSEFNMGDVTATLAKKNFQVEKTFGQLFSLGTAVYDIKTGNKLATIPNPSINQVNLFTDGRILAITTPGCCGTGIELYDAVTLQLLSKITATDLNADAVMTMNNGQWLAVGTEIGTCSVYDITNPHQPVLLSQIDLRALTGHTGSQDIEIRALAAGPNNTFFAGSTWGADPAHPNLLLPSMFELKVN